MESQNRQREELSLLEVLTVVFAVAVLILHSMQYVPVIVWLLVFVGFAHLCLFFAIATLFEPHDEDLRPQRQEAARTDVKLLAAITGLPISTSILMVLTHDNVNLFALANAFYLLSLAFAVWVVGKKPICVGDACKIACLAQVASYLVSASVHNHILNMRLYRLQDALAFFDIVPSSIVHLTLFFMFLRQSLQDQHTQHVQ